MSMHPQFVCLSMIVNSRAWHDSPYLSWMDCLSYAIERENDPGALPPLVQKTVDDAARFAAMDRAATQKVSA
jgi:hypothetical protein